MKPESPEAEAKSGRGKTIDMYHFFSRVDVLLFGLFILAVLIVVCFLVFSGESHAAVLTEQRHDNFLMNPRFLG